MNLTEKQWSIIYAALLETSNEVIKDCLGGSELGVPTDEEIEEVFQHVRNGAGMVEPS